MAHEIKPFSIRILVVEPAGFRTETLKTNPVCVDNPIADYDDIREQTIKNFQWIDSHLVGDPYKAMNVVVDVVKGAGQAKGRPWPLYLLLGKPAMSAVKEKCDKILSVAEEWEDLTNDLEVDN